MATLPTPILSSISSFDPSLPVSISFLYSGNQIEKKRLIIMNSNTDSTVYDNTQYGMKLSYELDANTLLPGQYIAQIQVFDFDGNSSELSQQVLFYCYSTPVIGFTNFKSKINTASVKLNLSYSQAQNDSIKEYVYYLYDYQKNLLSHSDTFYNSNNFSYTFFGLKNLTTYYVRCIAKSIHNIEADTGFVELKVEYIVNPNFTIIELNNNRCEGYINVNCNIVDIQYRKTGTPTFSDGKVDLTNKEVTYVSGYDISNEFSIFIKAASIQPNVPFFEFWTLNNVDPDPSAPIAAECVSLEIKKIASVYYCILHIASALDEYNRYLRLDNLVIDGNQVKDKDNNIIIFEVKFKYNLYSLKSYYEKNKQFIEL